MTAEIQPRDTVPLGKTIVLFSDGTGNSSAKLFKTNVWRLYEAVDLGPPAPDRRQQIAYYDDGVGTSGFKPLAMLGGIFGYGLKRNVLDIYKYACRNYAPTAENDADDADDADEQRDEIFAFGFSRGAFTTRLAIALIAHQGLVQSKDEAELDRFSRQAYREFRSLWWPRRLKWPTRVARALRNAVIGTWHSMLRRPAYQSKSNVKPVIRFVGVWDTVSAYGGPFAELTRAIDNWIFPLSMPDYRLNDRVRCARHALALDDERDAFHPLLWDEVHETDVAARIPKRAGRLQQVWFTGMHSDVGGGYPDESLSFVSLLWMMEEAEKCDLRTLDVIKARFVALASSAGPIHDSRKGLAAYYRYQPRKIAAWLDPVDDQTLGLRDPAITAPGGRKAQGLLRSVAVHESVISRIACGTDRYAPITLPEVFEIVPPQAKGENQPQPASDGDATAGASVATDTGGPAAPPAASSPAEASQTGTLPPGKTPAKAPPKLPLVAPDLRARLSRRDVLAARSKAFEAVHDRVWKRRITYFVTLGLTLLLAAMPLWAERAPDAPWLGDGRTWIDAPLRAVGALLPDFAAVWVNAFADNPFYFLVLAVLIWLGLWYGTRCEQKLRDRARRIWEETLDVKGRLPAVLEPSALTSFRTSRGYQRSVQVVKWVLLPDFVLLPAIALTAFWLAAAGATQTALPWLEHGTALCQAEGDDVPALTNYVGQFTTSATCVGTRQRVVAGRRYRLELREQEPWFDGTHATNALGLRARDMGPAGILGSPFRRMIQANYLQPIVVIRKPRRAWHFDRLHMFAPDLKQVEPCVYVVEFTADYDGELFLFANDAVWPLRPNYFYDGKEPWLPAWLRDRLPSPVNAGTATLSIVRLDMPPAAALAGQ
jgi:uncharacterized protein (DUF2235 family)